MERGQDGERVEADAAQEVHHGQVDAQQLRARHLLPPAVTDDQNQAIPQNREQNYKTRKTLISSLNSNPVVVIVSPTPLEEASLCKDTIINIMYCQVGTKRLYQLFKDVCYYLQSCTSYCCGDPKKERQNLLKGPFLVDF